MYWYSRIGRANEIENKTDKLLYRALEIMPGFLAWITLILIVALSFIAPVVVVIFIISFDIYWLIKTIYLSLHMRSAFNKMRANLKKDWSKELETANIVWSEFKDNNWQDFYHLIILPMAYESLAVVESSFESLAKSNYPLDKFIVVLATEERAGDKAIEVARAIEEKFAGLFFKFLVTRHPDDLPGEIRGKGSNEAWAAKEVKAKIIDPANLDYSKIITSVFDIDTVVPRDFFACLTWNYLTSPDPLKSSYQPIPLYTNNIWEAPAFARIFAFSTTFWQMMQQARPERLITFSSQSISFKALVDVGFWQKNVVSEDSRIFWQCYLHYNGDWQTVPMFYPVYMDANVAPTFWQTMKNQYKQIRRWAYGVENNPYFLFGFIKNKLIPISKRLRLAWFMTETSHSLPTNSFIIFLLGWLPLIVGGREFGGTVLAYNLPQVTRFLMNLSMIGLVSSAIISVVLLPPRPVNYGRFKVVWMVLQWILFPLNIVLFGAIPALDAQTRLMLGRYMGFWVTPKGRISSVGYPKNDSQHAS